ncbi:MAG TPA: ABC transporter permease, partial [Gemmatimonadaceae bacterium]
MSLFRNLFSRSHVDRELDEEVRAYMDLLTAEKIKAGMSPEDARRAARREAGTPEVIIEEVRDVRRGALIETTLHDLRYGVRLLRRSPGFAAIAILTLGLGIGANSAIFSVVNGVVRKPLDYPEPDRLMFISSRFPQLNFTRFWVSPPEYFDYAQHTKAFAQMGAYSLGAMNLSQGDQPERVSAAFVTSTMFDVLGVKPELGAAFTAEQDRPNAELVVMLSHELWQRSFGGDRNVIGKRIDINARPRTIVGVMPPGFDLHDAKAQLWLPSGLDPNNRGNYGSHYLFVVGRLAPGMTQGRADAELQTFLKQWGAWAGGRGHTPNDSVHRVQMTPLRDDVIGNVTRALWVLQGAVLLVLLIACANVANLLLARAESRHKEFAVRTALGASRSRVLRQFMAEGLLLSACGAAVGVALGHWGLEAVLAANPESIPRASEIGLDPWVVAFTMTIALGTGALFGLAPLLHMGAAAVSQAIREGGVRSTTTAARNRVRRGLVTVEIALAVMLVIGAGLLIRSFRNLTTVDAGFNPANRITFGLVLPGATYATSQARVQFYLNLQRQLQQIPGVERASLMDGLPPFREVNANDVDFEGYSAAPNSKDPIENVDYFMYATSGYFETMNIAIKDGRAFNASDALGPPVVIVNEALVKRFFPNQNPIGKRLNAFISRDTTWLTIVGVAKDVKQGGLNNDPGTELYLNYDQMGRFSTYAPQQMNIVIKTPRQLESVAPAIRQAVRSMDRTLPIIQLRTMEDVVGASVTRQRFLSMLLTIFAAVALTLAAIGTYGILSYMVTERHREIGIRMALGAGDGRVVRLVLGQGMAIAVSGIVLGVGGASVLSRLTRSLLYGVSPSDPLTFATVSLVIAVVAVAACVVPTRRAMRVDP